MYYGIQYGIQLVLALLFFLFPSISFGQDLVDGALLYGTDFSYLKVDIDLSRWLKVERPNAKSRDIRADNQANAQDAFKWEFFSTAGDGAPDRIDPKAGECVKYGDTVYIHAFGQTNQSLVTVAGTDWDRYNGDGDVDEGDVDVASVGGVLGSSGSSSGPLEAARFEWIIRSNPGVGLFDSSTTDPAFGLCINDRDPIYIQSKFRVNRWLSGARFTNNANIGSWNYNTDYAKDGYTWVVRKAQNGLPSQEAAVPCAARSVNSGYWAESGFTNGETTVTRSVEISRSQEFESTRTSEWSTTVERTVSGGFPFGGSLSVSVSATFSGGLSTTAREISQRTESTEISRFFDKPGTLWQFKLNMRDLCDPDWDISTESLVLTDGVLEPPCCLPGYFADNEKLHGPCAGDSPCSCSEEICNPTNQPTNCPPETFESPTSAPPPDDSGTTSVASSVIAFVATTWIGYMVGF